MITQPTGMAMKQDGGRLERQHASKFNASIASRLTLGPPMRTAQPPRYWGWHEFRNDLGTGRDGAGIHSGREERDRGRESWFLDFIVPLQLHRVTSERERGGGERDGGGGGGSYNVQPSDIAAVGGGGPLRNGWEGMRENGGVGVGGEWGKESGETM